MKKYEVPSIEILKFGVVDVITASGTGPNDPTAGEEDEF